ncbi:MAG: hypothetical protein H0V70_09035 [Ktedonobacteraceae bacterium]|nr:hypothetical protein [Ktedonobacteraceae bacterium]
MNIWDSVQRGLEKATQEATRRAKTLRLRSTIDTLTQQLHTQEDNLLVKTMQIFAAGQLTQSELLPLCQELVQLQQQLEQAQHELNLVQSQPQGQTQGSGTPPTLPAYTTPPSDYQPYDQTTPTPTPPPPPGVTPISTFNTVIMSTPGAEKQLCPHCNVALIPGDAYCHNCGGPTGKSEITQQPTMLVEAPEEEQAAPQSAATDEADSPTIAEEKDGGA